MSKIRDEYLLCLAEQLPRYYQIIVIGYLILMHCCIYLRLPRLNPRSPAGWEEPVFLLIGLTGAGYFRLSSLWQKLQLRWLFWMIG